MKKHEYFLPFLTIAPHLFYAFLILDFLFRIEVPYSMHQITQYPNG